MARPTPSCDRPGWSGCNSTGWPTTQPVPESWLRNYALTQEQNLIRFRDWCNRRPGCALHGSDAAAGWAELVERAERASLPAPSAREGATVSVE